MQVHPGPSSADPRARAANQPSNRAARTQTVCSVVALVAAAAFLTGCHTKPAPVTTVIPMPLKPLHVQTRAAAQPEAQAPPQAMPAEGVRAIYLTGWSAGSKRKLEQLVGLVDRTELNAMVIDVKDDGNVTYQADVPLAKSIASKMDGAMKQVSHIDRVIATCRKHNIWPIARIACFRDKPLGDAHPELAVHNRSGGVWHDRKGNAWLNPYKKVAWDYNVDLALDALKHGFREIQFDYVRFPTDGHMSEMVFPDESKDTPHEDQIAAFLKYAHDKVHAAGGMFSADVFGLTSMVKNDEGIGQKFVKVVQNVDYLCPMVYPSHYAHGEYHIPNPNTEPYKIIHLSVGDAQKRLKTVKTDCKLRPWIQDFSLYGVHYGPAQVKAQIKALSDLGIHEFLLWNAHNQFTEAALSKDSSGGSVTTAATESKSVSKDKNTADAGGASGSTSAPATAPQGTRAVSTAAPGSHGAMPAVSGAPHKP